MRDRANTKPFCNACGKTETLAHVFFECEEAYDIWTEIKPKISEVFECEEAYDIWTEIKPKISEVFEGEGVQCFKLALKLFPQGTTLGKRKMALTLLQIAMHQIWLNRNSRKHEGLKKNEHTGFNKLHGQMFP